MAAAQRAAIAEANMLEDAQKEIELNKKLEFIADWTSKHSRTGGNMGESEAPDARNAARMQAQIQLRDRREKLRDLYAQDVQEEEELLREQGLATFRNI
eukprot:m.51530 g.51530  ORF g.51530 m.51530 type:complete len:99 (-) comp10738_c0_seq1:1966-2262(-)